MPTRAHCSLLVALCALAYAAVGSGVGRAAVIVRGESFRANSRQGSRETGEAGVEPQKAAVRSQLEQLVLPLLFRGFGVDVYLETYLTPWAEQLQAWYGPFLRHRRTLVSAAPLLPPLESSFLREVLQRGEHSLLVLLRPDAWLKHTFGCAVAAANLSAILFAFREWRRWPEKDGWTRVADNFVFVPGWAFPQLLASGNYTRLVHHEATAAVQPLFGAHCVDFLLPQDHHDSDPAKDYNPLYRLAGRGEGLRDASSLTASYPWLDACLAATVAAVRERPPRIVPDSLLELPAPTASG